jgi:hypothetical protein
VSSLVAVKRARMEPTQAYSNNNNDTAVTYCMRVTLSSRQYITQNIGKSLPYIVLNKCFCAFLIHLTDQIFYRTFKGIVSRKSKNRKFDMKTAIFLKMDKVKQI